MPADPATSATIGLPLAQTLHGLTIGCQYVAAGRRDYVEGIQDEVRLSNIARSSSWIVAEYLTGNNTFNTFTSEEQLLSSSGIYESPINSHVIDLVWNGSWGDGTSGSTAFSATVANVGTNNTITFSMRVGSSISTLTSAGYVTLGTANSGTTFTKTKAELDTLGLGTGSIRYVQVKAVFAQTSGTNPKLDKFTLSFTPDTTSPTSPDLLSPKDYTKDTTKPTLSFKKATDAGSGMNSYKVELDPGKNKSYSTSSLPSSGNGSSPYVWKDDSEVKIEYLNENDSDSSNDEIRVYFKGLDNQELTEGKHSWNVTATDNVGNNTTSSSDFYIDKTTPSISELAIANISSVESGKTYNLNILDRVPSFSGLAIDNYQGSTVNTTNGSKDTFDKVSSGPQTITVTFKKLKTGQDPSSVTATYENHLSKDYSLTDIQDRNGDIKSSRFYVTIPYPLIDGYYQVQVNLKDSVGHIYDQPAFYVSLNTGVIGQVQKFTETNENLKTKITRKDEILAKTVEEKQKVKQEGYIVKIKVIDDKNKPVTGAKVTIHSKVQEATTDIYGIAQFSKVEPGQHKILIAYANFQGEQAVDLSGEVKEFDFKIQVKQTNPFHNPQVILVIGVMVFITFVTVVISIKAKKNTV